MYPRYRAHHVYWPISINYIKSINAPHIVLANKADKIAPTKVDSYVQDLRNSLEADEQDIILPFSSEKKVYTDAVWDILGNYIN